MVSNSQYPKEPESPPFISPVPNPTPSPKLNNDINKNSIYFGWILNGSNKGKTGAWDKDEAIIWYQTVVYSVRVYLQILFGEYIHIDGRMLKTLQDWQEKV